MMAMLIRKIMHNVDDIFKGIYDKCIGFESS